MGVVLLVGVVVGSCLGGGVCMSEHCSIWVVFFHFLKYDFFCLS